MKLIGATLLLLLGSIAQAETVNLVTGNDYAPYSDQQLPEGGMTTDIVRHAFAVSKVDVNLSWQPWARGFEETKATRFAGTFPYVKTDERARDFLYSEPIYVEKLRVFAKSGSGLYASNINTLKGKTICLPLGWSALPELEAWIKSGALSQQQPKSISNCAQMVAAGRADFFVTDQYQGDAVIQSEKVKGVVMSLGDIGGEALYLIAPKSAAGSKAMIETFNRGLAALKKSGEYEPIVLKHFK